MNTIRCNVSLALCCTLFVAGLVMGRAVHAGDLNAIALAGFRSALGVEVDMTSTAPTYLEDGSPCLEPQYRLRFYVNVSPAEGLGFQGLTGLDDQGRVVFAVNYSWQAQGPDMIPHVGFSAASAPGPPIDYFNTPPVQLAWGWHAIELSWRASDPGAANGSMETWVDGVQRVTLTSLDNETMSVETVRWGFVSGTVAPTGSFYLDQFVSQRNDYIGPIEGGALPSPSDWDGDGRDEFMIYRDGAWFVYGPAQ